MDQWPTGATPHRTRSLPYETGAAEGRDLIVQAVGEDEVWLCIDDDEWDADPVGLTLDARQAAGLGAALLPGDFMVFAPPAAGWPKVAQAAGRVVVGERAEDVRSVADDLSDEHLRGYIASIIAVLRYRAQVRHASVMDALLAAHRAEEA